MNEDVASTLRLLDEVLARHVRPGTLCMSLPRVNLTPIQQIVAALRGVNKRRISQRTRCH
jgi:hypothetical protein